MKKDFSTNPIIASPMVQSVGLGALGYMLTDYLYPKITNMTTSQYFKDIEDPIKRAQAYRDYNTKMINNQKFFRRLAGVIGFLGPAYLNRDKITRGYKMKDSSGNKRGFTGGLAAFIGGDESIENMRNKDYFDNPTIDTEYLLSEATKDIDPLEGNKGDGISNKFEKISNVNNALFNTNIDMSYINPMMDSASNRIPTMDSIKRLNEYPTRDLLGVQNTAILSQGLNNASNGIGAGMVSIPDIVKGFTRMGVGYGVGSAAGTVLGTIFSQPVEYKNKLSKGMGLATTIANTGILEYIIK